MSRSHVLTPLMAGLSLAACGQPGPEVGPKTEPPAPGSMSGDAPTTVNPLPEGAAPPQATTPPNKLQTPETQPG